MKQQQALSVLILGLFFVQQAVAWFSVPPSAMVHRSSPSVSLRATAGDNDVNDSDDDGEEVWHPDSTHPCWQNLLDDDCSMSTVYSASFVAGKWLKSMPCGEGIQDCDMPAALMTPDTYTESGVVGVDVMDLLHLKRAAPITKKP